MHAWTLNDTFAVILTGVTVVFVALIILILIISIMGKIAVSFQSKENKNLKVQPLPQAEPAALKQTAPHKIEEDDLEEVAVAISAAVAAIMGEEAAGTYKIASIQKVPQKSRSSWAKAGMLENTRSF